MKKILIVLTALSMLLISLPDTYAVGNTGKYIYVSQNGKDDNDGTEDNPVGSVDAALKIYEKNKKSDSTYTASILIHGGIYRISSTVNITASHDGLTILPYGDGEVKIIGSVKLDNSNFVKVTDAEVRRKTAGAVNLYEIDLSPYLEEIINYPEYGPQGSGTAYYELFANDNAKTLARWPNEGYAITGKTDTETKFNTMQERAKKWTDSEYAMVWGYWKYDWAGQPIYISSVDSDTELTLSNAPSYGLSEGMRYYAFNMLEELDVPGEYYIDINSKKLYYYPEEPIISSELELTVMDSSLFNITNACNVTIKNIKFELTRADVINAKNCENLTLDGLKIRNIGNKAVDVTGKNCVVENCDIYNVGGGGIYIRGGNPASLTYSYNEVKNNHIYNFGRIFKTYQPGIGVYGVGDKVLYNTIHDAPHMAIAFPGTDIEIAYNEIYDVVKDSSDSGAVYAGRDWRQWGKNIHDNYFHDINKNDEIAVSDVAAVYADDMLCGTWVHDNLFENCDLAMIAGGGSDNRFYDNILVNCKQSIHYDDRAAEGKWGSGDMLDGVYNNFIVFITNPGTHIDQWTEKFPRFQTLYNDAKSKYESEEDIDIGIPKNAVIKNNINYGEYVNNYNYYEAAEAVSRFGEVNTAEEIKNTQIPENIETDKYGAKNLSTDSKLIALSPKCGEKVFGGKIKLMWRKAGGYSDYNVKVFKDEHIVFENNTDKTYMDITELESGQYTWTVTASDINAEAVCAESQFTVAHRFSEDFQSYEPGIIAEGEGTYDFGAWRLELLDGDKAEIAQEENGNKYLKITRGNTSNSNTRIIWSFPEQTSGKMKISYDFLPEVNSKNFAHMGSLAKADESIINRIFSYGSDLWESENTYFKGGVVNKANYSGYVSIHQTVDINGSNSAYKFYSYGMGNDGNVRVRESAVHTIIADGIAKIIWAIRQQADPNWNGPDKNADCSNAGIYRIDNLIAEGEIYTSDVVSGISTDGTKYVISAKLHNDTVNPVTYQAIGVLKDREGKIISISSGSTGTVEKGGVSDLCVESTVNSEVASCEMYIWNGLNGMIALTKKITAERTQ